MLRVRRIEGASMKNLFMADTAHFPVVAARKLTEREPGSAPIHLTLAESASSNATSLQDLSDTSACERLLWISPSPVRLDVARALAKGRVDKQ
jgi:hypothetical protein